MDEKTVEDLQKQIDVLAATLAEVIRTIPPEQRRAFGASVRQAAAGNAVAMRLLPKLHL